MAGSNRRDGASDPTRREFFRTFGRQTAHNAGAVLGAAAELRRSGAAAARELFDLATDPSEREAVESVAPAISTRAELSVGASEPEFRSPYLFTGSSLVLLDQRDLPARARTFSCAEPTEIASAIRSGAIGTGPVLAEVAAYALLLAVAATIGRPEQSREQSFRAAANILRAARRDVRPLHWAIERVERRYEALVEAATDDGAGSDTARVADGLRAEADLICSQAALNHAALGRAGARAISELNGASDGLIQLLLHGNMGVLSCGQVGMGTALLQALAAGSRGVHVWLTEAAPTDEGARIAALELTRFDVPHTIIADSAVGWLLGERRLDAALLRGDTVCTNGDTGALIGSLNVGQLAASAGVPVYLCAPLSAVDVTASDGSLIATQLRPPDEAVARLGDGHTTARSAVVGVRLSPATDIVPAGLISGFFTEAGALLPPFGPSLGAAVDEATS